MKQQVQKCAAVFSFALLATSWSPSTYACSADSEYISSICVMASFRQGSFGNGAFMPANGQTLSVSNYQALYALIGNTYGGSGTTTFALPDLRGRVVLGAGSYSDPAGNPTSMNYPVGAKGGSINAAFTLTTAQTPPHSHTLNALATKPAAIAWAQGTLGATTTLTGLTATTTIGTLAGTVAGSGLTLKASTGGTLTSDPNNASLGTYSGAIKVYSSAAPTVSMQAGGVGGTANVAFSGAPTTTVSGNPTTTLAGTPTLTLTGSTDVSPGSAPAAVTVKTITPYLAMYYYIAVNGLFPTWD